jgi:molybdate transport system permease protein
MFPITLSLQVGLASLCIVGPLGIALAWAQAHRKLPLPRLFDAVVMLPMVLPPSVIGFFLVAVFGRHGFVGAPLEKWWGLRLVFSPAAAIIASCVVSLPIVVKTAQPAIESVPAELEAVARSLGLPPLAVFFRVTVPSAWRAVLVAGVLAFTRAIGEFGATLMFAGNIPGRTNTMPLEIFAAYQSGEDSRAMMYVMVLSLLSTAVVFGVTHLSAKVKT